VRGTGLAGVRTRGVATRRWRARATGLAAGALLQLEHACLGAARRPPLSAGLLVSWTFHARAVQERCTCVCRVFNSRSPMPDSLPWANLCLPRRKNPQRRDAICVACSTICVACSTPASSCRLDLKVPDARVELLSSPQPAAQTNASRIDSDARVELLPA